MATLFRMKRALLAPRTAMRRRRATVTDPVARRMLELHGYGRAMYDFMGAVYRNPDLLHDAELDEDSIVVDLGGYTGEWAERISDRYGSWIYVFEPNPSSFAVLSERLGSRDRVVMFDYGLGATDRTAPLSLEGPGSSMFVTSRASGTTEVRIHDAARVLATLGLEAVDLLKVNIEGGEYELFPRLAETGWLERVRTVSVQFHEWIPGAYRHRRAIRRALRRRHEEVWCYPWVWELWRRRFP